MLLKSSLLTLGLLGASIAAPAQNAADCLPKPGHGAEETKYLITFGDSYSQTGFNISLAKASAADPLGNPTFPGWTTDGGANWIGDLVSVFNTSLTLSYNFAYGGATVDASLVLPFEPTVLSFIDQVKEFSTSIASHPKTTPWTSQDTLFAIWLGVNDVGNSNGNATNAPLWDKIINKYFEEVDILYRAGGRNFAFLNVPPIQRTPLVLAESTAVQVHEGEVIASFNAKLANAAKAWSQRNWGTTVKVIDTQGPFNTALNHPTAYGANATGATCFDSDGVTCLWWNNYHPGQAIQKLVAKNVANSWAKTFF